MKKTKQPSIKCYQCKKVIKENPVEEYIGNKTVKTVFLHDGECREKFLQRRKDTDDFIYLCNYIKDIYSESDLEFPNGFASKLWDLRNGAVRYVKNGVTISNNMAKEGVPFDILIEAYQLAEKSIKQASLNKTFANRTAKYGYGLAIAKSKMEAVYARRKLKDQRKNVVVQDKVIIEEEVVAYRDRVNKPEKPRDDISDLFE